MAAIGGQMQVGIHQRRLAPVPARCQPVAFQSRPVQQRRHSCVVRAVDDDELDQRLAALKRAKGETPYAESKKRAAAAPAAGPKAAARAEEKKSYDYTDEKVHWEGGPAAADLAFNVALGATLVALPLTIGAITRSAFVNYKFTDKRVSVVTKAPWENKQTDCAYQEVKEVRTVSRGLGAWGDMVIELKNGDKLELRSLEKFKELKEYVLARRDALGGGPKNPKGPRIMDLDLDDDTAMGKGGKGFA
uniref:YdbS-like PH domain-containing protein n=1 Tax=Tetradesmus obliquus TaxID=3088 RepID=A0A383VHW1_TETOB|eukprot:jgi/Sobl393_1/11006/SZX65105.1